MEPLKLFELVLVRHAQSRGNAGTAETDTLSGKIDSPLTEKGRCQARLLGKRFSDYPFDCIISSGMERAVETAFLAMSEQPEGGASTVHISPLLTECGVEEGYSGHSLGYFKEKFGKTELFDGVSEDDPLVISNDVNDVIFNRERVRRFMNLLFNRFKNGERVMVVAHGIFNTELYLELSGIKPESQLIDPDFANTSVTVFTFYKEGTGPYGFDISLKLMNSIDHLRADFPSMFFENNN